MLISDYIYDDTCVLKKCLLILQVPCYIQNPLNPYFTFDNYCYIYMYHQGKQLIM